MQARATLHTLSYTMPEFKLYYFNTRGRAEPIRLCFAAAGVKYEDIRFAGEEWQQKKKEGFSPTGSLPLLEVDGKKLNESMAIMKYVARECGLSPSDSFEVGQCDMIVDMTGDLFQKMLKFFFEKDEDKKKQFMEEFTKTPLPNFMATVTTVLKGNGDGKGFIVGSKLSYADILLFQTISMPIVTKGLDDHPELKAHYERIGEIPGIKTWVETRPKTEH